MADNQNISLLQTAVTAAAAKGALGLRPVFLDGQESPVYQPAVEHGNGLLALLLGFHRHKAETAGLSVVQISDDLG